MLFKNDALCKGSSSFSTEQRLNFRTENTDMASVLRIGASHLHYLGIVVFIERVIVRFQTTKLTSCIVRNISVKLKNAAIFSNASSCNSVSQSTAAYCVYQKRWPWKQFHFWRPMQQKKRFLFTEPRSTLDSFGGQIRPLEGRPKWFFASQNYGCTEFA